MYMEGSVLSFLKAEWKVSDTGSAHWASSLYVVFVYKIHRVDQMQHYHFSRVDQVGIDQMGIDQMGVDQMGVDQVGINLQIIYNYHDYWTTFV